MQPRLPDWIDPVALIRQGRILEGTLPVARFARLADQLYDSDGEIRVELHFGRFDAGVEGIKGHITGELHLTCQRCLGRMDFPVEQEIRLGLVESEAMIERLPEGFEPLLVTEDRLALTELIEDELLLAVADFPKHSEQECRAQATDQDSAEREIADAERGDNPFAALTDLKKH
ncbi:MAG: metal-binding protein [Gammaproteobacteria bacterium]|nr:metal-binding protein [Gammaproteobacteria bacterium]